GRGVGATQGILQLAEALGSVTQHVHDAEHPFLAQRVQRGGCGALGAEGRGPAFRARADMRGGGRLQAGLHRAANGITGPMEGQPGRAAPSGTAPWGPGPAGYCTVTVMFMLEWILQVTLKVPALSKTMSTD